MSEAMQETPDAAFLSWVRGMADPNWNRKTVTNDHFWENLSRLALEYLLGEKTADRTSDDPR